MKKHLNSKQMYLPGSTGASKLEKMRRGLIVEEGEEDKSGPSWFVLNRVRSHQLPAFSHTINQDVT